MFDSAYVACAPRSTGRYTTDGWIGAGVSAAARAMLVVANTPPAVTIIALPSVPAAFMGPTVGSVPYVPGGAYLAVSNGAAKRRSPFRSECYRGGFNGGRTNSRPSSRSWLGSAGAGALGIGSLGW